MLVMAEDTTENKEQSTLKTEKIHTHYKCDSVGGNGYDLPFPHGEDLSTSVIELKCGWRSCKPKPIQKMNSPKWFLFFLVVFSTAQGMIVNGFTNVGLSTLEKQFNLTSKQSGMIVACKEISALLLIAFLSYYGSFGHKPKYLGFGALVTAFGSLLYVLPHALTGKYVPYQDSTGIVNEDICHSIDSGNKTRLTSCDVVENSDWYYMFIFMLAKFILGAGTAPLFTLGAAYIDENVKPKVAPIYLGIWYVSTFFGPGIGFVAGGTLLNVYVDLIQPPGVDLTPDDPRWIGAWWLGHFFGGFLILLTSCALLAYPRYMPGARTVREQAIRDGVVRPEDNRIQGRLKEMIPATLTLLKNPTYIFNTLALTCSAMMATGLGPFVVKYLQSQFGASTSRAGIASGMTLIPGTAGGIFLGSYLMKRLKMQQTCEMAAKYCFIFQLLAVASVFSFFIPGCNRPTIAGIHVSYYNSSIVPEGNLSALCNLDCNCEKVQFSPICGSNGVSYFSACQAGCLTRVSKSEYADCGCIDLTLNGSNDTLTVSQTATNGLCNRDCKNMIPFLICIMVMLLLNFIVAIPNKMVVLRCVPDNERAYALGLQWIFLSLLGSLPGPVLFGMFIDRSCDLWEKTCDGTGTCLAYNNKNLSYWLAGATLLVQVLGAIFYFLSWKLYKPSKYETEGFNDKMESSNVAVFQAATTDVDDHDSGAICTISSTQSKPLIMKETGL